MSTDNATTPVALQPIEIARMAENPAALLAMAVMNGTNPDTLSKLFDLQERWEKNVARKAFIEAMAAFKAEAPPAIGKDSQVDFSSAKGRTHYKYANLGDITAAITPLLSKHGLHASWRPETPAQGPITVTCIVTHVGGHQETVTLCGPADESGSKNKLQAIGSTLTYLQRYGLLSALGLATTDQDDDGRAAGQPIDQDYRQAAKEPEAVKKPPAEKPPEKPAPSGDAGIWTTWRDRVLSRVNTCLDGDTLQKAKDWLATQKCPVDIKAELDTAIRVKQDGLDIEASLGPKDAKQTPDNSAARAAEEQYTMAIMALTTLQALVEFKVNTLPTIDAALRPRVEQLVLIHQLTMETSIAKCAVIKEDHPELTDQADRRITEIKATMAEMEAGGTA